MENIFWVDGATRKAYMEAYHDCISFDTTYMTNMYNMPFAPFIGINRHGQSFMLGCGFVRQELASSFDWLFETFLEAMHGVAIGERSNFKKFLRTHKIMVMHSNERGECVYIPS